MEQALLVLAERIPPELWSRGRGYALQRMRESALREEVSQFAEHFFAIPPKERRLQWESLVEQCQTSVPLMSWLESLWPGLDVVPPMPTESDISLVAELTREILSGFVLSPPDRAAWEYTIYRRSAGEPWKWQKAAKKVKKYHPECVCLSPSLLNSMADCVRLVKAAMKARHDELFVHKYVIFKVPDKNIWIKLWALAVLIIVPALLIYTSYILQDNPKHRSISPSAIIGVLVGVVWAALSIWKKHRKKQNGR
jgi:hypothetical protein